jgi:hypothetical protein
LGGAVFVRSGTVQFLSNGFDENSAIGGQGPNEAGEGLGKGGAIFAMTAMTTNANGNDQGMPEQLPVISGCGNEFNNSLAPDADGDGNDVDNPDTFGTSRAELIDACQSPAEAVPVVGGLGKWLLAAVLSLIGLFGLRRRGPA